MIVVTGADGFIGSVVIWTLNQRDQTEIIAVDEAKTRDACRYLSRMNIEYYAEKSAFLEALQAGRLDGAVKGVIHLGACSSTTETDRDYLQKNNFEYTRTLARWCLRLGIRFVYASSAATYGDGANGYQDDESALQTLKPLNLYAHSKQDFDLWARDEGVLDRMLGLKYFNVFGPNEGHKDDMRSMVCKGYEQIRDTGTVRLFKSDRPEYADGGQERDFLYVKDAADMTLFALDHPEVNGIYNAGSGQANTWNNLITAIFKALGKEPRIEYIDMPEHLKGKYQYHTCAEMAKLREAGYKQPIRSLEDGVGEYVRHHLVPGMPLQLLDPEPD